MVHIVKAILFRSWERNAVPPNQGSYIGGEQMDLNRMFLLVCHYSGCYTFDSDGLPCGIPLFWALAPLLVWCHPPDRSKSCTFALYIFLPSSEVQLLGNKHQNTGPSSKKIAWKMNILCTALGKMAILCSIIIMTNLFVKSNPCRSIAALSLWKKWILGSCALPQEKFSSNAWLLWPNHHSYSIWIIKMLRFVKFVFSKLENNEETIKLHCKLFS